MNIRSAVCHQIGTIAFVLSPLYATEGSAAGIVGNGGDIVLCQVPGLPDVLRPYDLDYVLNAWPDGGTPAVEVESLAASRSRIASLLTDKIPALAKHFAEFTANTPYIPTPSELYGIDPGAVDGTTEVRGHRRWTIRIDSSFHPPVDTGWDRLPLECKGRRIFRGAVRTSTPPFVTYDYDLWLISGLTGRAALQLSFLLLHEWLWDFTDDIEAVRSANALLHSSQAEEMSASELADALRGVGLSWD